VALGTVLLLVPAIIYIIVTTLPPNPVTGRTIDKGFFDPFTTIETDWFSFRVEKTWVAVPEITIEGKQYFYREMQGANPQGLLGIFINTRPIGSEDFYTRVVPVTLASDTTTVDALAMQPHCDTATKEKFTQNHPATQADAAFTCWAGGAVLYAVASEIRGDDNLSMRRRDGSTATYVITYRNLAFIPNETTFSRVLNTFSSR
jgi:hypothetical protein